MGIGGQCYAPDDIREVKTRYPLYTGQDGPQGRFGRVRKTSPPPKGFESRDQCRRRLVQILSALKFKVGTDGKWRGGGNFKKVPRIGQAKIVKVSLYVFSKKCKAVPLRGRRGPEGSRKLRFPDYVTMTQDGSKVFSLTYRPPLPPGNTPGTRFC